jgi:hypothetical protein
MDKMEWISVEDELPKINQAVIGYTNRDGHIWDIYLNEDEEWITQYIRWSGTVVTHWMPLPSKPRDTETQDAFPHVHCDFCKNGKDITYNFCRICRRPKQDIRETQDKADTIIKDLAARHRQDARETEA